MTFSRLTPISGTGWTPRCATFSPATTSTRFARPSSRTPRCSPAASAKKPISSRKRCSPGKIRHARRVRKRSHSRFVPRTPPASSAPTSSIVSATKARCKSSTTSDRSSGASVRRKAGTASSSRSAPKSLGRPVPAASRLRAMPRCWRCWPPCWTRSACATGICN